MLPLAGVVLLMIELMVRPVTAAPFPAWKSEAVVAPPSTVMLWLVLFRSSAVPLIVGTTATFVGVEEILPVTVRMLPTARVGVAVPPLLLKTTPARVLLPTRVRVEPPLRVTMLLAAIWPALVTIVT